MTKKNKEDIKLPRTCDCCGRDILSNEKFSYYLFPNKIFVNKFGSFSFMEKIYCEECAKKTVLWSYDKEDTNGVVQNTK